MDKPCLQCTAKCCKYYDVFIDHEDVKTLYKIRGDFSFLKKTEFKKNFGYVPKFKLWENGIKKKWVLCLNNPDRICIFLTHDVCSIYNHRPFICRTYPFYLHKDKIKESKNLCPIKWKLDKNLKNQITEDYQRLLLNFLAFETICDIWNKIVRKEDTLDTFLKFVIEYE